MPQDRATWFIGHTGPITDARFSRDGARMITASADGTARVWDSKTGAELRSLKHTEAVANAAFSPDGRTIATNSFDGMLRFWDADTGALRGEPLAASAKDTGAVMGWSRDGSTIAVASQAGMLRCWDVASRTLRFENHGHAGATIFSVSFDPAGTSLVTTGDDNEIRIWDLHGVLVTHHHDDEAPTGAVFDSTGTRVLEIVTRQKAKIWNVATGIVGPELSGHVGLIDDAKWSPDDVFIVTAALDGTARVWEAATGAMLAIYPHPGLAHTASFSPDGKQIVVAGEDGRAAIHELPALAIDETQLARFFRCHIPFEVVGSGDARPRARQWRDCEARD